MCLSTARIALAVLVGLGIVGCRQATQPAGKMESQAVLPDGGTLKILHPSATPISLSGGGEVHELGWSGAKPGKVRLTVDPLGMLVNGRDFGPYRSGDAVIVDASDGLKVTVNGQERQSLAEAKPGEPVPAGHFRLSIEDEVATDAHIVKLFTIELPKLDDPNKIAYQHEKRFGLVGVGTMFATGMSEEELREGGTSGMQQQIAIYRNHTRVQLSLRTEPRKGAEDHVQGVIVSWPKAAYGEKKFDFSAHLAPGNKLSEVVSWSVQSGVYPVGKLLRLGRILDVQGEKDGWPNYVEVPVRLMVVDR
jgi:hypothetical protein